MAMERCDLHYVDTPVQGFWQHLGVRLESLGRQLVRWDQLSEQRRQLRDMDEHMLKDIGLSRADVERIAGKRWFWDDPTLTNEVVDERYRNSEHG